MTGQNSVADVKYCFPVVPNGDSDPDEADYSISLPEAAHDDLGLEAGAKDEVYMEGDSEEVDYIQGDVSYIWGRKTEDDEGGTTTEGYYDVWEGGGLKIPERSDDFLPHPLHQIAFEINLVDEQFRIYDPIDFVQARVPEHRDKDLVFEQTKPVVPVFPASGISWRRDERRVLDLTSGGEPGQKFRLIMFDAQHSVFQEEASVEVDGEFEPRPSIREKVVQNGQLPRYPVTEFRIVWAEKPTEAPVQQIYRYNGEPIEELDLLLPETGIYTIYTETEEGEMSSWLRYGDEDESRMSYFSDGWGGTCLEEPENGNHFVAYIPCKTISRE